MTTFANQFKNEVSRLAKREIKGETKALKSASSQYRSDIAALKRRVASLESLVKRLSKSADTRAPATDNDEGSTGLRFRAGGFASLRKKLGLSASEMARLLGVSAQSVYHWEAGKSRPRASQLPAIADIRKMRKSDVLKKLGS